MASASAVVTIPAEVADTLADQGFREGPPPWVQQRTLEIDQATARRRLCPECGRLGLDLVTCFRLRDRRWKGLAVCPACSHAHEV